MIARSFLVTLVSIEIFSIGAFQSSCPIRLERSTVWPRQNGQPQDGTQDTPLLPEIEALQESLASIRALPRIRKSQDISPFHAKVDHYNKPTFRRLFTHETWKLHIGGTSIERWYRCMKTTSQSVIVRAVWMSVLVISLYATAVSIFLPRFFVDRGQQLPLSLTGSAIGLLLVFRTNNAYRRLEEARELWGQILYLTREIIATVTVSWRPRGRGGVETSTVVAVCRYLAAFSWSLRDQLRDGDKRCDILNLLLDEDEAAWVAEQRSSPLAIHGRLRRLMHQQLVAGKLDDTSHFMVEGDLKDLLKVVASCERIFTSPIPPTMSRHGIRSSTLFFLSLPIVFAGSVPPILNVLWTAIIAFVYLGIDELGVQVEQPFQLIPLWQLCLFVQQDIEEIVMHPLEPMVVKR